MTNLPNVNKTILDNGIRILTHQMPYTRSVSMGVWVNVGARDESLDESGMSHFIEHMIFKGTKKRTAYQIAKEFDAIGGQTNAFTTMENTCYHARVMDTHLETMVDILSDIFLNSTFSQSEIEKERPVVIQEISMVEDSPEEFIHILSGLNYWGEHPLSRSILGTRENILTFDSKSIKSFFKRFYQPDRIVVAFAGNLEHNHIIDLVSKPFSRIKPGKPLPEREAPGKNTTVSVYEKDLEQVHLCLNTNGLPITDKRRYACSLMNTILGGNMSSRLFQEIREKHGLAYVIYSYVSSYVDTGMFGVYVGVENKNAALTTQIILDNIKKLKSVLVDEGELKDAKEYTKGCMLLSSESIDNQMVRLAQNEIHFNRYIHIEEILSNLETVTAEELLNLAKNLFDDNQYALTVLGPVSDTGPFESILTKQ